MQWIGGALATVLTSGLALVNILSLIFITPVVTFYMLRDWDRLVARLDGCLPREHADVIRAQARLIDQTLAGYARGQATVCLVLGVFYAVGLSLVGLDYGLVVGVLAGRAVVRALCRHDHRFRDEHGIGLRLSFPIRCLSGSCSASSSSARCSRAMC